MSKKLLLSLLGCIALLGVGGFAILTYLTSVPGKPHQGALPALTAEERTIDATLKRRTLKSSIRKEEAEARLAEIKAVDAEVELLKKLHEMGLGIHRDKRGNVTILPTPPNCDLRAVNRPKVASPSPGDPSARITDKS